jgi:N6-adenosine-specific RNA methylase IME4
MTKYNVILADPPWPYAKRNVDRQTKFGGGVHSHYETMTKQELMDIGPWVNSIADKNCALFMWYTGPRTDMAVDLIRSWGFRFATGLAFNWVKVAKTVKLPSGERVPFQLLDERTIEHARIITGPGNYSASNAEPVLLAVKGSMRAVEKLVPQEVFHPRMKHSAKPPAVRDRIVRMFGDVPRIELFARDQCPGWDASGLELDGTDYRKLILPAAA